MNSRARWSLIAAIILPLLCGGLAVAGKPMLQRMVIAGGTLPGERQQQTALFPDTLRVLAIMVQFQNDDIALTTGNGTFDLSTTPQRIIDAPPHDSAYVADHFIFANNYFKKASHGKQHIAADVLGKVITLPSQMRAYAPVGSTLPLVSMMEQAWHLADSLYPAYPFQKYTLFVIIHAGAGKDIDFRATYGYDPTPYDIPSLYISAATLKTLKGPSYTGIPLPNHPGVTVNNSVILPESENRMISSATGDFLFQLGINGLLVSSIGSHLGLPDLFNTKTGGTAIGRFGLMDGQAIFSFSGIFPPQPSAWERQYLGWATPVTVDTGSTTLYLRCGASAGDTIYKLPMSAKEYFLLENRDRDPESDGVTLTMRWNGTTRTKTFTRDTVGFNASAVDSAYGTVLDVDNMDWSLPGADGYRGGALLWHIDETIIDSKIGSNSINADPDHRGVNLEEADGSQDLGQSYGMTDAGSGSEDGWPLDFWYAGNGSPIFKNIFDENSHPPSISNTLAASHISLKNFSVPGPVMTVQAQRGDGRVTYLKNIRKSSFTRSSQEAAQFLDVNGDGADEIVYGSGDSIYVLKQNWTPLWGASGLFATKGGAHLPVIGSNLFTGTLASNAIVLVTAADSIMQFLKPADANNDGVADTVVTANCHSPITSAIATPDGKTFVVGLQNGSVASITIVSNTAQMNQWPVSLFPVTGISVDSAGNYVAIASNKIFSMRDDKAWTVSGRTIVNAVCWLERTTSVLTAAVVCSDGSLTLLDCATMTGKEILRSGATGGLAVADLDGDGSPEIVAGATSGLYTFSKYGVVRENFPLRVLDGGTVTAAPSVARAADGRSIIFYGSTNGHLYAADGRGASVSGFPLQTGGVFSSPVVAGNILACASADSAVGFWNLHTFLSTSQPLWNGPLGDRNHTNLVVYTTQPAAVEELLPAASAYNWPNPTYDRSTNIRYRLGKAATVHIRIFNMAGELVDELNGTGDPNTENEVVWDVSKIKSGVYFAVLKAVAGSEEKSCKIKIAVIK